MKIALTLWSCFIVLGVSLIVWSVPLSLRYYAWTTSVRQRQNRAPTPEMRQLNEKIMIRLFRTLGISLVLLVVFGVIAAILF